MDFLKQCPLLIFVVLASLLIPWDMFKEDDTLSAAPIAVQQTTTTMSTEPTETINTNSVPIQTENSISDSLPVQTTTSSVSPTLLAHADESYFEDALFIGNSRTVGLYLFGNMPESTDFFADVGLNIYHVMEDSIAIPPQGSTNGTLQSLLSAKQYGKIYIMFGINELGIGSSASFAEYYASVVSQIHEQQPEAIIYIQSIINVSSFAESDVITNSNINEKNALLEEIADNKTIFYINVNETLTDSYGYLNEEYTSDGIHLGGSSLPLWKECLLQHAIQSS